MSVCLDVCVRFTSNANGFHTLIAHSLILIGGPDVPEVVPLPARTNGHENKDGGPEGEKRITSVQHPAKSRRFALHR